MKFSKLLFIVCGIVAMTAFQLGTGLKLSQIGKTVFSEDGLPSFGITGGTSSLIKNTCRLHEHRKKSERDCLRTRTAKEIRMCLQDKHVLFFGDSLSRYMYLQLLVDAAEHDTQHRICNEKYSKGSAGSEETRWATYFAQTNKVVQLSGHVEEICDCFRSGCCEENQMTENRYSWLPRDKGRVSFINQVKSRSWHPHGNVNFSDFETMKRNIRCTPGECNFTKPQFRLTNEELVRRVKDMSVTHLLMNFGFHWKPDAHIDSMRSLFKSAVDHVPHVYWKTTTGSRFGPPKEPVDELTTKLAVEEGVNVLDFHRIIDDLVHQARQQNYSMDEIFVDRIHFTCPINTYLNDLFLDSIC